MEQENSVIKMNLFHIKTFLQINSEHIILACDRDAAVKVWERTRVKWRQTLEEPVIAWKHFVKSVIIRMWNVTLSWEKN